MDDTSNHESEHESPETVLSRDSVAYTALFCEENVWHLCQLEELAGRERLVVFISNLERGCPFWQQRAAPVSAEPILWDYHVVLLARRDSAKEWAIFDVDSRLNFPIAAATYLRETFPHLDLVTSKFWPSFRIISVDAFVETFSSDRSHMRDEQGTWLAPPPEWPLIETAGEPTFDSFVDFHSKTQGEILSFGAFRSRFAQ